MRLEIILKGQRHEIFHKNIRPGPLIEGLQLFRIYIRISEVIQNLYFAWGVIDTACI
jgi:hypothetical protein